MYVCICAWRKSTAVVPAPVLLLCWAGLGCSAGLACWAGPTPGSSSAALPFLSFSSQRCSFIYGTPTMFIDMISQPNFESYDLSSLRGGKSDSSNGKTPRNWILLVPCWEAGLSFASKSLFLEGRALLHEFCVPLLIWCYISFPWAFLPEICTFKISSIFRQTEQKYPSPISCSRELSAWFCSALSSHHRVAADALCALGWRSPYSRAVLGLLWPGVSCLVLKSFIQALERMWKRVLELPLLSQK